MSRISWRRVRFAALGLFVAMAIAPLPTTAHGQSPAPEMTLWRFLGIPQGAHRVHDSFINRRGNFPDCERKPPLLRLADPALAQIDNAAIKKAQQIKTEEDLAPQKIKAVKYLASLGCQKCYRGIEEAMIESLKDCTESVRYETVKALAEIPHQKCPECDNDCCTEKITKELAKMAYERDPDQPDCWLEPSARVRRAAMETLRVCCPGRQPPMDATAPATQPSRTPVEGGDRNETPIEGGRSAEAELRFEPRNIEPDYDVAMEIHVAPRRDQAEDNAPDPNAERSVVVTNFRDADARRPTMEDRAVQPAEYIEEHSVEAAPPPRRIVVASRSPPARRLPPIMAEVNSHGRRYVTWGTPHGDYAPRERSGGR
jgi:hypothetical protein